MRSNGFFWREALDKLVGKVREKEQEVAAQTQVSDITEPEEENDDESTLPTKDNEMESNLLFVYGSLKRGGYLAHALTDAHFVGEFITRKAKYSLFSPNDNWPMFMKGDYHVAGEVYKINEAIRNRIDWVEGHPQLFERALVKIRGLKDRAYIYKASGRLIKAYEDLKYESEFIVTNEETKTQHWIVG